MQRNTLTTGLGVSNPGLGTVRVNNAELINHTFRFNDADLTAGIATLFRTDQEIRVRNVISLVDAGEVEFVINFDTDRSSVTPTVLTEITCANVSTGAETTDMTLTIIPKYSWIWVEFETVTDATELCLSLNY